jgi:MFS transporter, CP family, cyanate transporter
VLFATQSLLAYVIMSWLPAIFRDAGLSAAQAGGLLGLSILIGVPLNFAVPMLAARLGSQSILAVGLTLCTAAGFAGLLAAPGTASWLWVLLLGVGGAVFPVTLVLFSLRTRAGSDTAALSAMAQGIGYLLAAAGPFGVGMLHDRTGSWTVPLILVLAVCAIQLVAARAAGRDRHVSGSRV